MGVQLSPLPYYFMKLLFIDTNVYLSYLSKDKNLPSLKELKDLIKDEKIKLITTSQIRDEYLRQAPRFIDNVLKEFAAINFTFSNTGGKISEDRLKEFSRLVVKGKTDFKTNKEDYRNTKKYLDEVDKTIIEIFNLSNIEEVENEIISKAQIRYIKGNPPRKSTDDEKYGDCINWEFLLAKGPKLDITMITTDSDFTETLGKKTIIKSFLQAEWEKKTNKKIKLIKSLGEFLNTIKGAKKIPNDVIEQEKKVTTPTPISEEDAFFLRRAEYSPYYVVSGFGVTNSTIIPPGQSIHYCIYCGHRIMASIWDTNTFTFPRIEPTDKKKYTCTNIMCGKTFEI